MEENPQKRSRKEPLVLCFFVRTRKKKFFCWMNGAQSKGIEPRSKQVRNLKYTVQW